MAMFVYRRVRGPSLRPIWVLIGINVIFFILTLAYPSLLYFMGFHPALFAARPWTIISNMFAHYGLWHIIANMFTLYFFGRNVLYLVGRDNFLAVYFIGGIVGNLFFMALWPPDALGVGASGAIFALGGAMAVMRPKFKVLIFPIPIPMSLWIAIIVGFVVLSFVPGIAWQAHLGGLISGVVAGLFFKRRQRRPVYV